MKVAELKMELQRRDFKKCYEEFALKSTFGIRVNNLPIISARGEGNEAGGTQVTFSNPENGCITGLRSRELCLKKYNL